ncbi:uncharacterized protein LOC105698666 isoform X2 [Orussus abietinus]|uniref:uncharacterized protein LOC105698666 isoform X2 n=1 Tax=Orussus abietinus TaxID=222816 RepID=UPI000626D48C|nr:uncharacterized protein LOC105698666 isoform X2 [Orussus abietinus]
MSLIGKVVLITGASSGIGAATAIHFSQLGAQLSLTGRNIQNLQNTVDRCKGPKPFFIIGELTNESDAKNILNSTIEHYGKLDVLVNNAGILEIGSIENTSLEQFDNVNGIRSFPNVLAYCMSKSAVDQFTRCVALELAEKQVRVNSVNPGVTETNLHKTSGMQEKQLEEFFERGKSTHPLGRVGDVAEVAKTIAFLASDDASFITGATLPVDGGRHALCPR